jgi:hypothetical protein
MFGAAERHTVEMYDTTTDQDMDSRYIAEEV